MTRKLTTALILSIGLSTAALAQTTGSIERMPNNWMGPIGEAFYTDMTAGTLRTEAEVKANWPNLSAEQQAQVKADCATFTSGSGPDGGNESPNPAKPLAGMSQLCAWVNTM